MANYVETGVSDGAAGVNGGDDVNLDNQNHFGDVSGRFFAEGHSRSEGMNPNFGNFGSYAFAGGVNPNLENNLSFGGRLSPNLGNIHFGDGGPSMVSDPYGMPRSEVETGKSIVKRVLTGRENYIPWKIAMEIALSGRSQLGFVRGEYPKPNDPTMMARWQKCNDIIMS